MLEGRPHRAETSQHASPLFKHPILGEFLEDRRGERGDGRTRGEHLLHEDRVV